MARKTSSKADLPTIAPSLSPDRAKARFQKLIDRATELLQDGRDSPGFSTWRQDVQVALSQYFGRPSLQLEQFDKIRFGPGMFYTGMPDSTFIESRREGLQNATGLLKSRIDEIDEEMEAADFPVSEQKSEVLKIQDKLRVFLVHGQNHGLKDTIARYIEKIGLDPIILHEQPNKGKTLIEKFEAYADVGCAVVLLTADDTGSSKQAPTEVEDRARQNVVFEMGFFVGSLGRTHTIALLEKGVKKPSDIDGLVYIPLDDDSWKLLLVRELKAAGMQVDANRAFD